MATEVELRAALEAAWGQLRHYTVPKEIAKQIKAALKPPSKPKLSSRIDRWMAAASRAKDGLDELVDIQSEYSDWQGNLPENLQGSALGEKLQAVCDLDLEGAQSTIEEAEGIDLPRGFGQD